MTTIINPTRRRSRAPVDGDPVTSTGHAPPVLLRLPDVSQAETDSGASLAHSSQPPDERKRRKLRPAIASWLIMAVVAIGLLGLAYWWINRGGETGSPPIGEAPAWNGGDPEDAATNDQRAQPSVGDSVMPAPPCSMPHDPSVAHRPPPLNGPVAERRDRDYPTEQFDLEGPDYRTSMRNVVVPSGRRPAFDGMPRHGSPKPVQPGVARLQGTIEKAPIESHYEHIGPSFY